MMGSIPMNRHEVELQFGRHWNRITTLHIAPTLCKMPLSENEAGLVTSLLGSARSDERGHSGSVLMSSYGLQRADRVTGCEPFPAASLLSPPGGKDTWFDLSQADQLRGWLMQHGYRDVTLQPCYRRGQRLRLYGDVLGSEPTRFNRSSYVLVYMTDRLRPVQCNFFADVFVTTKDDKGVITRRTFRFVHVRWFSRYYPESDGHDSKRVASEWKIGPLGDTVDKWWLEPRPVREDRLPFEWLPIHRIVSRFVMAPCSQDDTPLLKRRKKADPPPQPPLKLFRTCPLPLQLPL